MNPLEILQAARTILVIDFPSKDVPESLALAGFDVIVRGGPGPEDFFAYEVQSGQVVERRVGAPPQRAELIYFHRPLAVLQEAIDSAKTVHARTVWTQSGLRAAGIRDPKGCWLAPEEKQSAFAALALAGLHHISEPYIGDVARQLKNAKGPS